MIFDKNNVYTSLNADKISIGSKIIAANSLSELKDKIRHNKVDIVKEVKSEDYAQRFITEKRDFCYFLAYLISESEEYRPYTIEDNVNLLGKTIYLKDDPNMRYVVTGQSDCEDNGLAVQLGDHWESYENLFVDFRFLEDDGIIGLKE